MRVTALSNRALRRPTLSTPCKTRSPVQFYPKAPATAAPQSDPDPIVGGRVELQLLTTLKCNLKCSYCSLGVGEVLGSQVHVEYDIEQLAAFVGQAPARARRFYVTFYGGEPT